jgi:hypothetical protein
MIASNSKYFSLLKIGLYDRHLFSLVWGLKNSKKTYLTTPKLWSFVKCVRQTSERHPGRALQIAEFGVGRGGSAVVLAWLANRYGGTLTLYDVFGRIPSPGVKDGEKARERYQFILKNESKEYYGNISNLLEVVKKELSNVCDPDQVKFVQGKYEDTLPLQKQAHAFDFVHIDCDWYESSKTVMKYLQNNLNRGAILQVDDYSNWQGSQLATDETEWLRGSRKWLVDGALIADTAI